MTTSQFRSVVAMVATIISAICAAVLPYVEQLPPQFKFYGTIVSIISAAAGSVVMVLNQSLSANHVSVPVEDAVKLGLVNNPVTKSLVAVVAFSAILALAGCSKSDINRSISLTGGVKDLVVSYKLSEEVNKLAKEVADDLVDGLTQYRDDPTEDKYQKALNLFDSEGARRLIGLLPPTRAVQVTAVFVLARTIFTAFAPQTLMEMAGTSEDAQAVRKDLKSKIDRLEKLIKARD